MPAKDFYHDAAKNALINDGWTITDDPYRLRWGEKDTYVDLGAEKVLGAKKGDRKIAVEIKSFVGASDTHDLEQAIGQYALYSAILLESEPDRELYLAVRKETWNEVFQEPLGKLVVEHQSIRIMVFDNKTETVYLWQP